MPMKEKNKWWWRMESFLNIFKIDILSIDGHWDWKLVKIQRTLLQQTNISVDILLTFLQAVEAVFAVIGIRELGQIVF